LPVFQSQRISEKEGIVIFLSEVNMWNDECVE